MAASKRRYTMTARAAKAQATRERICKAASALYLERPMEEFTVDAVARSAETTVQTVLRAFGSRENLIMAALTAVVSSGTSLKRTEPGDIPAAIDALFDIYESIGDVVIARLADERRIPALQSSLDEGRAGHRAGVAQMFAPYLQRHRALHEMLCVVTDVYVWKILRRDRGFDRATAQFLMTAIVTSVVRESAHGEDALAELVRRRKPAAKSRHSPRTAGTRK